MSIIDLARAMSSNNKDKDRIKTQFDSADATAYFKFFVDDVTASDMTTRLKTVDSSDEPVWDRDQEWWDNTSSGNKFVWQSESTLTGSPVLHAVVNSENKHIEPFLDTAYKNTSSTATWTGGGSISF